MTEIHKHGGDIYRHKNVLDFSSNCNPYGTPEGVKKAGAAAMELVCHYPDVECESLRRALAQAEGVPMESIICGNGAADLIFGLALALKPAKALLPAPTFAEYEQALTACGCETEYYFLSEEEGFRPGEGFLDHIGKDMDMVFFCNPNNPTGVAVEPEYLKKLAQRCRDTGTFLVLDECFEDFLEEAEKYSMKGYLEEYPQMFLLKAFTKEIRHGRDPAGIRLLRRPSDPGKNERSHAAMECFCSGPGGGDRRVKRRDICERVYEEDPKGKGNPSGRYEKTGIFHICLRGQLYFFQRPGRPSGKMPGGKEFISGTAAITGD